MRKLDAFVFAAILALVPGVAGAAIDLDDPGDDGGTGGGTGGTGGDTPTGPQPTWLKTYSNTASLSMNGWGAGWSIYGKLAATPKTTIGTRDKLEGSADLNTFIKINGYNQSVFRVNASAVTQAKYRTDASITAYVGGASIYTKSYTSATSTYTWLSVGQTWPATFIDRSATVSVGPIPVTFRVRATGELTASLTGKISNVGLEMGGNSGGKANLYASAAVGAEYCVDYLGCVGASAGVYASLKLFEVKTPATLAVWWSLAGSSLGTGVKLNYLANAGLQVSSLDGELGLTASACLGGCLDWSTTLIDWDGWVASSTLYNVAGSYCLTGTCSGDVLQ